MTKCRRVSRTSGFVRGRTILFCTAVAGLVPACQPPRGGGGDNPPERTISEAALEFSPAARTEFSIATPGSAAIPSAVLVSASLSELPAGRPETAEAVLDRADVQVTKRSGAASGSECRVNARLLVAPEGHPDPCASSIEIGRFTVIVTRSGDDFRIEPPAVTIPASALDLLLAGSVQVCMRVSANFIGSIEIAGLNVTFDPERTSAPDDDGPPPPPINKNIIVFGIAASDDFFIRRESHRYGFNGRVGDRILVDMTTMALSPSVRVLRPDDSLLCAIESASSNRVSDVCVIDVEGTYHVIVTDLQGRTGDYGLFVQRVSEIQNGTLLVLGRAAATALETFGARHTYTFNADPGDRLLLTMNTVGLSPFLEVFRPNGTSLCAMESFADASVSGECVADASGTFRIIAGDVHGRVGDYGIFLQRMNQPLNATTLVLGQAATATLGNFGDRHTYVFNANPGDRMFLSMNTMGLSPSARIFRPNGTQLCAFEAFLSPSVAGPCVMDASGTFRIVAGDLNGSTGEYGIFLQRTSAVVNSSLIVLGQPVAATLANFGARHTYTFNANPGDHMVVSMSTLDLDPSVRVYRPDGTLSCLLESFVSRSVWDMCAADASGTYKIVAGDPHGRSGDYGLFVQRTGNPPSATFLNPGDTVSTTLETLGARHTYAFNGSEGDQLRISLTSNNLSPVARVYRSDGTLVCTIKARSSTSASELCVIDTTSPHMIVAGDLNGQTGTISITLERVTP